MCMFMVPKDNRIPFEFDHVIEMGAAKFVGCCMAPFFCCPFQVDV